MNGSFRVPSRQALDLKGAMNHDFISIVKMLLGAGGHLVGSSCDLHDKILSMIIAFDPETGRFLFWQILRRFGKSIVFKVSVS